MATKTASKTAETTVTVPVEVDYLELINQAGDTVLDAITETQETFLKAAQQATEQLPAAPEFSLPGVELPDVKLPTPRQLVEANFAFADKYLANQKAYAAKFLEVIGA